MIDTSMNCAASSALRIAPTRPSIMSEGAMISQPASAWTMACLTNTATVSSLRMTPSRSSPSWPWLVKGSSATSQRMPTSGTSRLIAPMARQTRLSGLSASLPVSSRRLGSVYGKSAMQGMARRAARSASRTAWSIDSRSTPGIEGTGMRVFSPSITNKGQIRSSALSTCSRTMRRAHSLPRLRRIRVGMSSLSGAAGPVSIGVNRVRFSIGRPNLIAIAALPPVFYRVRGRAATRQQDCRNCWLAGCAFGFSGLPFHFQACFKTVFVPIDRGDGHYAAAQSVADDAVALHGIALDVDRVPFLCVTDIVDRNVVVLAPEERGRSEWCRDTHHIEGGDLPLPFGDHPMLDADAFAGDRIRPAGDIAGGVNSGRTGFHVFVDDHALVDREAGLFGERQAWTHSDPDHNKIGVERASVFERHALAVNCTHAVLEMEFDPMLFMQRTDEVSKLRPEYPLERAFFRRHYVNLDVASAQRSRGLQTDEACADHHGSLCAFRLRDDRAAIVQRA